MMSSTILKILVYFFISTFCLSQSIINKNTFQKKDLHNKEFKPESYKKFTRAKSLEKAGLWEDAEKIYKEINSDDPGNKKFFKPLKNILKQRSEWDELIVYGSNYSKANNNDSSVKIELGEIYIWAGKVNDAKKIFNSIINYEKNNSNLIKIIIGIYANNGVFDEAEIILSKIRQSSGSEAFFSMEMARYYSNRMVYDKALSEYLIYVVKNPTRLNFVSDKIISFLSSPEIAKVLIKQLKNESSQESNFLLSDIYFNQKQYKNAYDLLIQENVEPRFLLDFSKDLIDENQLSLAEKLLSSLYNDIKSNDKILEQAIFNLAVIYEKKTVKKIDPLPLSGFYKQNSFFTNHYLSFDENQSESLNDAINIYDSLITSTNSIEANYRLGEIRYRILGDLDGAFKHYNNIIQNNRNKKYIVDSIVRLVDIYIAKGNMVKAKSILSRYNDDYRVIDDDIALSIKEAQVYLYAGNIDSLSKFLENTFSNLSLKNNWYNDILELRSLLFDFNQKPELFKLFSESQLLLKKNKREEALRKIYQIIELSEVPLLNAIKYQASYILVLQGNYKEALDLIDDLEGESLYIELSIILKGEIYDYILNDYDLAIDYYLELLENYPNSIYYDQVRLRLRELAS